MSETKVKAIVIGSSDYKEKDKLVKLFTLEGGIITVIFKGVKNPNAKLKSAKELFAFGDYVITDTKFKTVTSAEVISSFYDITKNYRNYLAACNILKIINVTLPDGQVSSQLFVDTLKAFNILDSEKVLPLLVLNKYLIRVFEGFGYKFDLNKCSSCGVKFVNKRYMNLRYGEIVCKNCCVGEIVEIPPSTFGALRAITNTPYEQLSTLKISESQLQDVFNLLNKNFNHRFDTSLDEI